MHILTQTYTFGTGGGGNWKTIANLPANVPMHMAIDVVTAIITNIYNKNKQTKADKITGDLILSREELRRTVVEAMHVDHNWHTLVKDTLRTKEAPLHLMLEQITAVKVCV